MSLDFSELHLDIKAEKCLKVILNHPFTYYAFVMGDSQLISYLKDRVDQMFALCFEDSKDRIHTTATRIFQTVSNPFVQIVIDHNLMNIYFQKVFMNEELNEVLIGRYSFICTIILASNIKNFDNSLPIFIKMLKFCRFPSVFYFFNSVFIFPDRYKSIKQSLKDIHLEQTIAEHIRRVNSFNFTTEEKDESLIAWYKIIICAIQNDEFDSLYINDSIWEVLTLDWDDGSSTLLDTKWEAISMFCKKAEPNFCLAFLFKAKERLLDAINEPLLSASTVSAIDVITSIFPEQPNAIEVLTIQNLIKLLFKFPNATFLQLSVIRIINKMEEFHDIFIESAPIFVPLLLNEAETKQNGNLWVAAYEILGIFYKASIKDQELFHIIHNIGDFHAFIEGPWQEREKMIETKYGYW